MPEVSETILAPALDGGEWLQHGPVKLGELRGKAVVLVDFWDYTCVNCIRTLPYVVEWHRRYARHGFVIVGVHAPEFSFAREHANVTAAIRTFGIEYPVVLDNAYAIWRTYSNRFWPAKYLIDSQGRIRYYHCGEGAYEETEQRIQGLLGEIGSSLTMPPPMEPVRDSDRPGAFCYRVTPELYLGYARGQFGNPGGPAQDRSHDYHDPGRHVEGAAYLGGRWTVGSEYAEADAPEAALSLRYTAKDVNLVLAPPNGTVASVELALGPGQRPGEDACVEGNRVFINVDRPRMYNLVANDSVLAGALQLRTKTSGLRTFAFTFVSCAVA